MRASARLRFAAAALRLNLDRVKGLRSVHDPAQLLADIAKFSGHLASSLAALRDERFDTLWIRESILGQSGDVSTRFLGLIERLNHAAQLPDFRLRVEPLP